MLYWDVGAGLGLRWCKARDAAAVPQNICMGGQLKSALFDLETYGQRMKVRRHAAALSTSVSLLLSSMFSSFAAGSHCCLLLQRSS
jgi:hypothetical protein